MTTSVQFASPHVGSVPYPGLEKGHGGTARVVLMAFHVAALLLLEIWVLMIRPAGWRTPAVAIAGLWLVVGPLLIGLWQVQLRRLSDRLKRVEPPLTIHGANQGDVGRVLYRLRLLVVAVPVVLIVPTPWSAAELADALHVTTWNRLVIAVVILVIGGVAAGYGLLGAISTIVIVRSVAIVPVEASWSPFAGNAPQSSEALAGFSFSSACLFGAGGTCLLPGLLAGALRTRGPLSTLLFVTIGIIGVTIILLIALPAALLARRGQLARVAHLDRLASQIGLLEKKIQTTTGHIDQSDYHRLRSLLELRTHIIGQQAVPSSVDLVRRMPIAILLPLLSTGASWLALL